MAPEFAGGGAPEKAYVSADLFLAVGAVVAGSVSDRAPNVATALWSRFADIGGVIGPKNPVDGACLKTVRRSYERWRAEQTDLPSAGSEVVGLLLGEGAVGSLGDVLAAHPEQSEAATAAIVPEVTFVLDAFARRRQRVAQPSFTKPTAATERTLKLVTNKESLSDTDHEGESQDTDEEPAADELEEDDELAATVEVWDLDNAAMSSRPEIQRYINALRQLRRPLLRAEQEVERAVFIEAGLAAQHRLQAALDAGIELDPDYAADLRTVVADGAWAMEDFLASNIGLAVTAAFANRGRGLGTLELVQVCILSVYHAIEKFDYTLGYKFSTYATWWLRKGIQVALRTEARTIKISGRQAEAEDTIKSAARGWVAAYGYEPSVEELAREVGMLPEKVVEHLRRCADPISFDTPLEGDPDADVLGDMIIDPDEPGPDDIALTNVRREHLVGDVRSLLASFSDEERAILEYHFGLRDGVPRTDVALTQLPDLPRLHGRTRQRASQVRAQITKRLLELAEEADLRKYFGGYA